MEALCAFVRINVSAGTYLVDFGTNVLTLVEYYMYKHGLLKKSFYSLLMLMAIGHIIAAVTFKMTLPEKYKPLRCAYFLPLMLFWRMVKASAASWRKSLLELELMDEATALFGIVSLSLETAPAIYTQYSAIYQKRVHDPQFRVSLLLKLSIAAALVSAAFNGGIAVASKAKNVTSRSRKALLRLLAGIHISSAMLVRCMVSAIVLLIGLSWIPFWLAHWVVFWVLHWLIITPGSFSERLTLRSAGFASVMAYMGTLTSPLYTVISEAQENGKLGTRFLQLSLAFMAIFLQSVPFTVFSMLLLKRRYVPELINNAFVVSLGLAHFVSICSAFGVIVLDYCCGPVIDHPTANGDPEIPRTVTEG